MRLKKTSKQCSKCNQDVHQVLRFKCLKKAWHRSSFKGRVVNVKLGSECYEFVEKLSYYCSANALEGMTTQVPIDNPSESSLQTEPSSSYRNSDADQRWAGAAHGWELLLQLLASAWLSGGVQGQVQIPQGWSRDLCSRGTKPEPMGTKSPTSTLEKDESTKIGSRESGAILDQDNPTRKNSTNRAREPVSPKTTQRLTFESRQTKRTEKTSKDISRSLVGRLKNGKDTLARHEEDYIGTKKPAKIQDQHYLISSKLVAASHLRGILTEIRGHVTFLKNQENITSKEGNRGYPTLDGKLSEASEYFEQLCCQLDEVLEDYSGNVTADEDDTEPLKYIPDRAKGKKLSLCDPLTQETAEEPLQVNVHHLDPKTTIWEIRKEEELKQNAACVIKARTRRDNKSLPKELDNPKVKTRDELVKDEQQPDHVKRQENGSRDSQSIDSKAREEQDKDKTKTKNDESIALISTLRDQVVKLTCDKHALEQAVKDKEQALIAREQEIKAKEKDSKVLMENLWSQIDELVSDKFNLEQMIKAKTLVVKDREKGIKAQEKGAGVLISALRDQVRKLTISKCNLDQAEKTRDEAVKAKEAKEKESEFLISALEEKAAKLLAENHSLKQMVEAKDKEVKEKTKECSTLRQNHEASKFEVSELKRLNQRLEVGEAVWRSKEEAAEKKYLNLKTENQSLIDQLRIQEQKADKEKQEAEKAAKEINLTLEEKNVELSTLTKNLNAWIARAERLKAELADHNTQKTTLEKTLQKTSDRLEATLDELKVAKKDKSKLEVAIEGRDSNQRKLADQCSKLTRDNEKLRQEQNRLKVLKEELESKHKRQQQQLEEEQQRQQEQQRRQLQEQQELRRQLQEQQELRRQRQQEIDPLDSVFRRSSHSYKPVASYFSSSSSLSQHEWPITQKLARFVTEPMSHKPVTGLPGIGKALGGRLEAQGFSGALDVQRQFRALGGDREQFTSWLKATTGANRKQAGDCYRGLANNCF